MTTIKTHFDPLHPDWCEPGALIDQTQAANITSDTIEMRSMLGMSVQVDHGAVTGTLSLLGSNDGVTFYAATDVEFAALDGNAGGELVEIDNLKSLYYKFQYVHSSGTGLLKVTPYIKGRAAR